MKVLVTGGTGWVGRHLLDRLEQPVVTTRNPVAARDSLGPQVDVWPWASREGDLSPSKLSQLDAVVNLMGAPLAAGRWNPAKKQRIRTSRVEGTARLVDNLLQSDPRPQCFISASAVGYYGDCGDRVLDEESPPGNDFLARVCADWEEAALPLVDAGVRVVWLRIGVVLGAGGGALDQLLTPFRWGLGGRLASGNQWMSWIHLHDLVNLIVFSLSAEQLWGPVNAAAPNPVRNRDFTRSLGSALHRPTLFPVPKFALRLAVGELSDFIVMSQRVDPKRSTRAGFSFTYPQIGGALEHILRGDR